MDRFILIMLVLMTAGAVMSLLLARFFKRKWVWYLPSMIGVLLITFISLKIHFENMEGFTELGYLIMNFMAIAVIIGNLLANIFINLIRKRKGN